MKEIEAVLATHVGRSRRISKVDTRPSARRSSFSLDEVDVRFEDGGTIGLIAKAVDWDALSPEARRAKPPFVWDERREMSVYEFVMPDLDLTRPRYFGSYVDRAGVRHLLIERVQGVLDYCLIHVSIQNLGWSGRGRRLPTTLMTGSATHSDSATSGSYETLAARMDFLRSRCLLELHGREPRRQEMNGAEREQICGRGNEEDRDVAAGRVEDVAGQPRDQHAADGAGHAAEADHRSDSVN